jgi:hypothetical protein
MSRLSRLSCDCVSLLKLVSAPKSPLLLRRARFCSEEHIVAPKSVFLLRRAHCCSEERVSAPKSTLLLRRARYSHIVGFVDAARWWRQREEVSRCVVEFVFRGRVLLLCWIHLSFTATALLKQLLTPDTTRRCESIVPLHRADAARCMLAEGIGSVHGGGSLFGR